VIGHECAGVIEEVGSEVKTLVAGDCAALEPRISCWRCKHCKGGRYNLCPDMKFFATPPITALWLIRFVELNLIFFSLRGSCSTIDHHFVLDFTLDFFYQTNYIQRLRCFSFIN
jgi:Alcohol dehydrogenase GroES-like domain